MELTSYLLMPLHGYDNKFNFWISNKKEEKNYVIVESFIWVLFPMSEE